MLRRIKYRLLRWLLDDICDRFESECEKCFLTNEINVDGYKCSACFQDDVLRQARRVWDLMYPWEKDIYGTDDE